MAEQAPHTGASLLAKLTPEQAEDYSTQLFFFGKAAIYDDGHGNVRVLSPAELSPDYRGDGPLKSVGDE